MVPSVRSWIDRHRIVSLLAVTCGFTRTIRGSFAASGTGAPGTLSIPVGFGGFEPPVGVALAVALAVGTERLSAREVPDPSGIGLNDGAWRVTGSKGMQGTGPERQG